MKIYKPILFLFFILTLVDSCIGFDKAVVYRKNYIVEKNSNLRFDGFYALSICTNFSDSNKLINPYYFYSDGSHVEIDGFKDTTFLTSKLVTGNLKNIWGYWGNYTINKDTIIIETFPPNGGTWTQERYLQKGIISNNKIELTKTKRRNENWKNCKETLCFISYNHKPDSTENWIRHKRKYNR